jgi:phosphate transport system substrate-binding protein
LKKSKWLLLPLALIIVPAITIVGCGESTTTTPASSSPATTSPTSSGPSGELTIAGSTTVQPVAQALADAFTAMYLDVSISVSGGGSSVGVTSCYEGTVDIGMASRELSAEEEKMVIPTIIARDGIGIAVHPSQTVTGITLEQIREVFSGTITNWSDLGGADEQITVIAREEGSGTRGAFEEIVMGGELITATAILQSSNGALRTTVSSDPNAIGFLSMGYLDETVKFLDVDGVEATPANAGSGAYPVVRPLNLLTREEPAGLIKAFIDFALGTEGQAIIAEDYIPVN